MKIKILVFAAYLSLCLPLSSYSQDVAPKEEILAERGKGVVTQADFTARADKIPKNDRFATLRDGNRMRDVINALLLRSQLAADAQESGFDQNQIVIDRMRVAANTELAEAWLQHYVESKPHADYEQLAREYFQINQERILSSPKMDVSHILVSTKERSDEEALALAENLYQKLIIDPTLFDDFVMEYSEDPSVSSNKGKFKGVKQGDMVKPFEDTAFALQPGQISGPVTTNYGYHIIRLDKFIPPQRMSFDEVRSQLVEREKIYHEDRIRKDYLDSLTSLDVNMTKEALEEAIRREFGEEVIGSENDSDDLE